MPVSPHSQGQQTSPTTRIGHPDLPKGPCRYILIATEIRGQRCSCSTFSQNKTVPGAICDCGHLACYHVNSANEPTPSKNQSDINYLKGRVAALEQQVHGERGGELGRILSRVTDLEDLVDKNREEMQDGVKGSYRSISGAWQLLEQLQSQMKHFEKAYQHQTEQLESALAELREFRSQKRASGRIENTLEDGNTIPLRQHERPSTSKGQWTISALFLPSRTQSFPFENGGIAYKRCLSRGLYRTVVVKGPSADHFATAVEAAFGHVLQGQPWEPLRVSVPDTDGYGALPMLQPLDSKLADQVYDAAFLQKFCAVCDAEGKMKAVYLGLQHGHVSWEDLREMPVYLDGLEASWEHDAVLDSVTSKERADSGFHGSISIDPMTVSPRLKRGSADISQSPRLDPRIEGVRAKAPRTG